MLIPVLSTLSAGLLLATTLVNSPAIAPAIPAQLQSAPMQLAQKGVRVRRIAFAAGKDSATVTDSIVLGSRDIWVLNARQGQRMQVKITSLEQNAVFEVVAPKQGVNRRVLQRETTLWTRTLPQTGDYQLVVGSTRGNATYTIQVSIRSPD